MKKLFTIFTAAAIAVLIFASCTMDGSDFLSHQTDHMTIFGKIDFLNETFVVRIEVVGETTEIYLDAPIHFSGVKLTLSPSGNMMLVGDATFPLPQNLEGIFGVQELLRIDQNLFRGHVELTDGELTLLVADFGEYQVHIDERTEQPVRIIGRDMTFSIFSIESR